MSKLRTKISYAIATSLGLLCMVLGIVAAIVELGELIARIIP